MERLNEDKTNEKYFYQFFVKVNIVTSNRDAKAKSNLRQSCLQKNFAPEIRPALIC
jgi:hypothetical protein